MFQGPSSLSLDVKGRLSMPTRHRDVLGKNEDGRCALTITKHPHGCLLLYPQPVWEQFREKVAAMPYSLQWFKRIVLGSAMDVEMDAAGRLLVPPELREWAGIVKDAMLLGMDTHFELWDKATHTAKEAEFMKNVPSEALDAFVF